MSKATELVKEATVKHKGIFFYINRNKKLGKKSPKKTGVELIRLKKAIKQAKLKVKSRGK